MLFGYFGFGNQLFSPITPCFGNYGCGYDACSYLNGGGYNSYGYLNNTPHYPNNNINYGNDYSNNVYQNQFGNYNNNYGYNVNNRDNFQHTPSYQQEQANLKEIVPSHLFPSRHDSYNSNLGDAYSQVQFDDNAINLSLSLNALPSQQFHSNFSHQIPGSTSANTNIDQFGNQIQLVSNAKANHVYGNGISTATVNGRVADQDQFLNADATQTTVTNGLAKDIYKTVNLEKGNSDYLENLNIYDHSHFFDGHQVFNHHNEVQTVIHEPSQFGGQTYHC